MQGDERSATRTRVERKEEKLNVKRVGALRGRRMSIKEGKGGESWVGRDKGKKGSP